METLMANVREESRVTGDWTSTNSFADLAHSFNALYQSSGFPLASFGGGAAAALPKFADEDDEEEEFDWSTIM